MIQSIDLFTDSTPGDESVMWSSMHPKLTPIYKLNVSALLSSTML